LFARVNPLNPASGHEVDALITRGARVLMLPMVRTAAEAREFVRMVDGEATVVLLVENAEAIAAVRELAGVEGVDEVHIGINDLALSLGLRNRWLTLAGDLALTAGAAVRAEGKRFGLAAVGRAGDRGLPVPAELVYAEYARTGASAALVSRSFFRSGDVDLTAEVAGLRAALASWHGRSPAEIEAAHAELGVRAAAAPGF